MGIIGALEKITFLYILLLKYGQHFSVDKQIPVVNNLILRQPVHTVHTN